MAYPADYKYTKEHEWLKVEGNTGTIGITDYAQGELGDIVYVELPKVGARLSSHDVFGTVEAVNTDAALSPYGGAKEEPAQCCRRLRRTGKVRAGAIGGSSHQSSTLQKLKSR